jgi:hypothetical protein
MLPDRSPNGIERQSRTCRTLLAAALLSFFVNVQAQEPDAQSPAPKTGSITGRVVNENGQPLTGATINIRQAGAISLNRAAISNLEGNFQFNGLDNGIFYLTANSPAYVGPPMDIEAMVPTYRVGDSVRLELTRGGVVTGTVSNATGEPMTGVRVRAFMIKDANGKATKGAIVSLGERQTDDRGIYRIFGLSPGTYLVQAGGGGPQYSVNATSLDAPTFAPSSTRDTASEIQVRSGEETTADIRYRNEPGHSISGSVRLHGQTGGNVSVTQVGDGVMPTASAYQISGATGFAVYGLADGEYSLTAQEFPTMSPGGSLYPDIALSDPVRVTIKGADVTGIELVPKPLGSIAGKVVLENAKLPECQNKRQPIFSETIVSIVQNRTEPETDQLALMRWFVGAATPDKDGVFALKNLKQGQYSFSPRFYARYWYLKSMSISAGTTQSGAVKAASSLAKDATRNWTSLKSGDRVTGLTITLSEGAASIRGQLAKSEDSKVETGLRIYLVPSEKDKLDDPLRYFTTEVGGDGTFTLTNLPPGKYRMLAQQPPADSPTSTDKLRLPDALEVRAKVRQAAETAKTEVELKPCQNVTGFSLRPN